MRTTVSLPPYPDGWYAMGLSKEIPSGALVNRRIGDEEIVLFRTESGVLNAIEAYCPHLGAHLGHGGTVQGRRH